MALRNLLVRIGADISGLSTGLSRAQKQVGFFGRNVTGSMKEIGGGIAKAAAAIGGAFTIKEAISDASRYEALMATLGESMGASRKDFEKWMNTTGVAFGYSNLQAANTANILSLNFKKIATSQADLTAKTTKMMEVAAIVANKRGMTMEEVSDRIRSAMNGEADGADELGVNVRASAIMQSQAYKELGNNQPFDKLSEATRKTILYQAILEQVTANLGSTMQDTTAARIASFTASLANLRLALGQAFLPIVYAVLPYLTMLVKALTYVMSVIAAFMRSLFGGGFKYKPPVTPAMVKTTNQQANAMNNAAGAAKKLGGASEKAGNKSAKAAKKAKDAWTGTFGFDEVNSISKAADSGAADAGAGGGGGGGIGGGGGGIGGGGMPAIQSPTFDTTPFTDSVDKMAKLFDKYTQPIRDIATKVWSFVSSFAQVEFYKIVGWWKENGGQISEAFTNAWNLIKPVILFIVSFVWESVKGLIQGVITFFEGLIEFFTGVFTGDWGKAWQGLKDMFIGAIQAIWNFTNLTLVGGLKKLFLSLVEDGIKIFIKFGGDWIALFKTTWLDVSKGFLDFIKAIKQFFTDFGTWFEQRAVAIGHAVMSAFEAIGSVGVKIWAAIKGAFSGAVEWFARTIITPIANKFESIKNAFHEGLSAGFKAVLNSVRAPLNDMIGALNGVKNAIPGIKNLPNIPSIPYLAKGGITSGPTLAMVGDNRGGREVISPLDRLQGMLTTSVVQAMSIGGGTAGRTSGDIILNIDGRAFARIVKPFLDREIHRAGNDIRIRTI
jgi:hypothetical protein